MFFGAIFENIVQSTLKSCIKGSYEQNGHKEPLLCFHLGAFTKVKENVVIDLTNFFTQAAELNWNFKIGAQVNQIMILHITVSSP